MKGFTSIILLASFVIAQYAKQVSYLECRLSNYFNIPAEKCDCEKILIKDKGVADQSPLPVPHNHVHVDETYFPPQNVKPKLSFPGNCVVHIPCKDTVLSDGFYNRPDRPPAV
ncbi:MAG: hypothetical protein WDO71_06505 [Bacteroidota bacterium]